MHLIVDTSTERAIIVLAEGSTPLFVHRFAVGYQSARTLFTEIEKGLAQLEVTPSDLGGIAVAVGPGLFTGIRVGVAAAKGLAYARKLPLVGLSSLSAFVLPVGGRFYSVIDGRSRGVYALLQERSLDAIHEVGELELLTYAEVEKSEYPLVGPSFARITHSNVFACHPDPDHLALLTDAEIRRYQAHSLPELQLSYH